MKLNAKDILRPTLMLFVICLVVTGLLAGTNLMTKDIIKEQEIAAEENSRKVVLPDAVSFEEKTLSLDGEAAVYYDASDASGAYTGRVFTTKAKGYGGDVSVMTGFDKDGGVSGVVILSQSETPGLGANATKQSFLDQFRQNVQDSLEVIKSGAPADGQIQALTGATITSKAVTSAVNQAIAMNQSIKEGE